MHIGSHIKSVFEQLPKHQSVTWLAQQLYCDRRNIYRIFQRDNIDVILLHRLSVILNHDFFMDLSKEFIDKSSETK
ncbi:MAG: XRE family transcriptional regulator [Bacteroidales bacterium]|nr:XRE family transcriptional regulator [Bacteroidales bacterium]